MATGWGGDLRCVCVCVCCSIDKHISLKITFSIFSPAATRAQRQRATRERARATATTILTSEATVAEPSCRSLRPNRSAQSLRARFASLANWPSCPAEFCELEAINQHEQGSAQPLGKSEWLLHFVSAAPLHLLDGAASDGVPAKAPLAALLSVLAVGK